jgi:hypothetical protein
VKYYVINVDEYDVEMLLLMGMMLLVVVLADDYLMKLMMLVKVMENEFDDTLYLRAN